MDFEAFVKIPRLKREITITEKLDGTNAQIAIGPDGEFHVGSRTRWITPEDDNFGFARWCYERKDELIAKLGEGRHYGEWWGAGIQRRYGMTEKKLSLFNVLRWKDRLEVLQPLGIRIVPVLYLGPMTGTENALRMLREQGSQAAPGFHNPEGIVVYHHASRQLFKETLEKDAEPKGNAA